MFICLKTLPDNILLSWLLLFIDNFLKFYLLRIQSILFHQMLKAFVFYLFLFKLSQEVIM